MPWRVRKAPGGKGFIIQKQLSDGRWVTDGHSDTKAKAHASVNKREQATGHK